MNRSLINFCIAAIFFVSAAAQAHEISGLMGASTANPGDFNATQPTSLNSSYGMNFGADGIWDFSNFGIGLRYDSVSSVRGDAVHGSDGFEISAHLFSLLARKRWEFTKNEWTPSYLTALATVGVYSPSFVSTHAANSAWIQYKTKDVRDYAVAGQAGWQWDPFILGVEVGYQYILLRGLATDASVPLGVNVDMSGGYGKGVIGLYF